LKKVIADFIDLDKIAESHNPDVDYTLQRLIGEVMDQVLLLDRIYRGLPRHDQRSDHLTSVESRYSHHVTFGDLATLLPGQYIASAVSNHFKSPIY
jgi:hypothetical protein